MSEHEVFIRVLRRIANAQLRLFATEWSSTDTTDAGGEPANCIEDTPSYRHARAYGITNRPIRCWQSGITTSKDPVEGLGEPRRLALLPERHDPSSGSAH